jgi:hypothetical protein
MSGQVRTAFRFRIVNECGLFCLLGLQVRQFAYAQQQVTWLTALGANLDPDSWNLGRASGRNRLPAPERTAQSNR